METRQRVDAFSPVLDVRYEVIADGQVIRMYDDSASSKVAQAPSGPIIAARSVDQDCARSNVIGGATTGALTGLVGGPAGAAAGALAGLGAAGLQSIIFC
ncbi:MAG: hypothetical protein Q4G34_00025 [Micrococcus sp.]|nr:hypothetical protein [Micrococcus sp.]